MESHIAYRYRHKGTYMYIYVCIELGIYQVTYMFLHRLDWTWLDWTGLNWTELDWTGLNWTELDWTGLDWTELNWTGLDIGCWIMLAVMKHPTHSHQLLSIALDLSPQLQSMIPFQMFSFSLEPAISMYLSAFLSSLLLLVPIKNLWMPLPSQCHIPENATFFLRPSQLRLPALSRPKSHLSIVPHR